MESLFKKQPTEPVQNKSEDSVLNKTEKPVQNESPSQKECAGWCGEVIPVSQLKEYRKKMYCPNCYALKMDEVEKAKKPAGLTEDAVNTLIQNALKKVEIPISDKLITRLETQETVDKAYAALKVEIAAELNKIDQQLKSKIDFKLRDLVVAAKTIMGHFVGLDRFTKQNTKQGNDMRAWIAQADKVLEGK